MDEKTLVKKYVEEAGNDVAIGLVFGTFLASWYAVYMYFRLKYLIDQTEILKEIEDEDEDECND